MPETGYSSLPAAKQAINDYIIGYYSQIQPCNDGSPRKMAEEKYWNAQKTVVKNT